MKRTRFKPIAGVVLGREDLARAFTLLQREAAKRDPPRTNPMITISSDDGTMTETDDPTVLDDLAGARGPRRIELRYSDHRARRISVVLEEVRGGRHNSAFRVSGENAEWVDAIFAEFERLFAAARRQSRLLARIRWLIIVPVAIAIGYSWTVVLSRNIRLLLPEAAGSTPPSRVTRFFGDHRLLLYEIFLILFCLPWLVLARSLVGWVEQLWPAVEFDFATDHRRRARRVRFRLAVITALLALPIVIAQVNSRIFGLP
jgi:hypothetical protein